MFQIDPNRWSKICASLVFFCWATQNKWSQMASPSSLMSQMEPGDSTYSRKCVPKALASFELDPHTSNNHPLEKRITCLGSENQFINFRCCSNPDFCLNPCVFDSWTNLNNHLCCLNYHFHCLKLLLSPKAMALGPTFCAPKRLAWPSSITPTSCCFRSNMLYILSSGSLHSLPSNHGRFWVGKSQCFFPQNIWDNQW